MKTLIFSILTLLFLGSASAEIIPSKSDSKARVMKGCLASKKVSAEVCNCVTANFDKKLSAAEYKLLADNYDMTTKADTKDGSVASALDTFDLEVAENCIKNTKWRVNEKELKR